MVAMAHLLHTTHLIGHDGISRLSESANNRPSAFPNDLDVFGRADMRFGRNHCRCAAFSPRVHDASSYGSQGCL